MDQNTLVDEQIYDGRRFIERFAADGNPVEAAFWAKTEDGGWFLYVATELADRLGPARSYRAVNASLDKLGESGVTGSEIKVVSPGTPIAKYVIAAMNSRTRRSARSAIHIGPSFDIERIYVYPRHLFTMPQPNPMTSDEIGQEILRLMREPGHDKYDWVRVTLKDGRGFEARPQALLAGHDDGLVVQFLENTNPPRPRVEALGKILSIN